MPPAKSERVIVKNSVWEEGEKVGEEGGEWGGDGGVWGNWVEETAANKLLEKNESSIIEWLAKWKLENILTLFTMKME